jgi:uncharacterized protein YoxC
MRKVFLEEVREMAVAVGIGLSVMGVAVGLLGILCVYVWNGNHKMEKAIMEGQKILVEGQREIAQILKDHTQMLLAQTRILERIEGKIPAPSAG